MLRSLLRLSLAAGCVFLGGLSPAGAQAAPAAASTNAAASGTNAPATTAPATIPLSDVVAQAQTVTTKLQDQQAALTSNQAAQGIDANLPVLAQEITQRDAEDAKLLDGSPSLFGLESAQAAWQSLAGTLTASEDTLSTQAKQVDTTLTQLGQLQTAWTATLATAQKAPPEIAQRIQAVIAAIGATTKAAQAAQAEIFSVQTHLATQKARLKTGLDNIVKAQSTARTRLFTQDHPYLWDVQANRGVGATIVAQEKTSLGTQLDTLEAYLKARIAFLCVHLLIMALLVAGFFWVRRAIKSEAEKEVALVQAARIFDVPVSTGVLLALLVTGWFYPLAPPLLWAAVGAIALFPAVIVIRRLIDPPLFPILYATVIAYFVDQLRYVLMPAGLLSRFLFLFELLAVSVFLLVTLRSGHLARAGNETNPLRRNVRIYFHVAFFMLLGAGFANVFGLVHLGYLLGNGTLKCSYLAVIFYAAVRIADALVVAALSIRPLAGLRMVRRHRDLIYTKVSASIRWLALALWILAALQLFSVRDPLWQGGQKLLTTEHSWGTLHFKLDTILAFPITVWAAFLLSRFIRFFLAEEIYPNLQLARGIPYATSTMVHYTILVVGFYIAVKALGVDLTQFTVLVGAFGVGLGFGLQNILNNFVSGVILLFERPVKVGDIVQIDTNMGTVQSIGIRASIIRLTNGSEIIMPNGNLISNPVTNWTLSNCERLVEIPVTVVSKVDPQHVVDLLTQVVTANADVLKNPSPQTLLVTLGGAALTFRVRVWLESEAEWMKITSDLSLAINAALAKENIAMS